MKGRNEGKEEKEDKGSYGAGRFDKMKTTSSKEK